MKQTYTILTLLAAFLLCASAPLSARSTDPLSKDSRIRTGTLPNGLTYYIVSNNLQKGYADFFLAQHVGGICEDEDQLGMTAFLTDLALRSSRNFPDNSMVAWFGSMGVNVDDKIVRHTDFNGSYIGFRDVPVGVRKQVCDSVLLALYNISWCADFNPEDILLEKEALRQRTAASMGPEQRLVEACTEQLFPGGKFAMQKAATVLENVENFNYRNLSEYYRDWFTADRQAVIVAGDVDADAVETMVKSLFFSVPRSHDIQPQLVATLPSESEPRAAVIYDEELQQALLNVELTGASLRGTKYACTGVALVREYLDGVLSSLTEERLRTEAETLSFPVFSIDVASGKYMQTLNRDKMEIRLATAPESIEDALDFVVRELERIKLFGFSDQEYNRVNARWWKRLDAMYESRATVGTNRFFSDLCLANWFDDAPLAGIDLRHLYMKKVNVADTLALPQVNAYASLAFNPSANSVVTYSIPSSSDVRILPGDAIDVLDRARLHTMMPFVIPDVDSSVYKVSPAPVDVLFERTDASLNCTVWEFANGARAVFRKSDNSGGRVLMSAVARGGYSLMDGGDVAGPFLSDIFDIDSIGGYSRQSLRTLLADKDISFGSSWDVCSQKVGFGAAAADFDLAMKLLYLQFTSRGRNAAAFEKYVSDKETELSGRSADPYVFFADTLQSMLRNGSPYAVAPSAEALKKVDYAACSDFISQRLSNAADYAFVFVGNIDAEIVKKAAQTYIGTLPGKDAGTTWGSVPYGVVKSSSATAIKRNIVAPQRLSDVKYIFPLQQTAAQRVRLDVLTELLSTVLNRRYAQNGIKISVSSSAEFYPEEMALMDISFREFAGEDAEKSILPLVQDMVASVAAGNFDKADFDNAVSRISQRRKVADFADSYRLEALEMRYLLGKDVLGAYDSALGSLTLEQVKEFAASLAEASRRSVTMQ